MCTECSGSVSSHAITTDAPQEGAANDFVCAVGDVGVSVWGKWVVSCSTN